MNYDKKNLTIIVLIILLVGSVFYFYALPKFKEKYYNLGVQEGSMILIQNIWNSQQIPRIYLEGNETKIQQVSFGELCGVLGSGQ